MRALYNLFLMLFLTAAVALPAQQTRQFTLQHFPAGKKDVLILLQFYGENFEAIDSAGIYSDTTVAFHINNFADGLYAIKLKSEKDNQAEFILTANERDVILEAPYVELLNGAIAIENSRENEAYLQLIKVLQQYDPLLEQQAAKLEALSYFKPDYKKQLKTIEDNTEYLFQSFDAQLIEVERAYANTFAAEVLVPLNKKPFRSQNPVWPLQYDGYRSLLHDHFFDSINTNDNRLLRHYAYFDKIRYYLTTLTDKTSDGSKEGIDIIMNSLKENEDVNSFVYTSLLKVFLKYKSEVLINYITEKHPNGCALNLSMEDLGRLSNMQNSMVGSKGRDILLYDVNGKVQSLYEQCKKNKVTLLVYWISWCSRCKKETPEIERLYEQYKKLGLGLFAVSVDEKKEEWEKALAVNKLSGINVSELVPLKESKVLPLYNVTTTPAIFLLDKDGKILAKNIYGPQLEAELKKVLK